jgi:hypothetical protein
MGRCLLLDGTLSLLGLAATARLPASSIGLALLDAAAYSLRVFSDFDRERRRIEEALHDGVQQDLAATLGALELARALLDTDPAAARSELEDLTAEVEAALERVRALARSVYPSILPARGLTDALRSLDVETADLERYPLEIEEAVYFSCNALRNRASHARVWSDGATLRFELLGFTAVEDDELSRARERIAEAGGQLELSAGRVSASVPLR